MERGRIFVLERNAGLQQIAEDCSSLNLFRPDYGSTEIKFNIFVYYKLVNFHAFINLAVFSPVFHETE